MLMVLTTMGVQLTFLSEFSTTATKEEEESIVHSIHSYSSIIGCCSTSLTLMLFFNLIWNRLFFIELGREEASF